ncbi:hypothetical protein [Macrococcus carouselicus]|uniref:Uncharacterized protein n=1 Tax=Macrococcus carouselicus TaxID=69969 RepID=A0A9Q8CL39_9STAP|nr:hypothetical protein [Macrococcus carouselicus]TDM04151.1 hypothetical protein ERX40_02995 [Macrococcus carouselicus]
MNKIKINRLGEINVFNNSVEYVSPLENFRNVHTNQEKLLADYRAFLKQFNHSDVFCHITRLNGRGKYITFDYFLENNEMYSSIRYQNFTRQLELFYSLTEIAEFQQNSHVQILWDLNNFVIAHQKGKKDRIKAILHDFGDLIVFDQTSALEGLKRLVLLGLVKQTSLDGKPQPDDYINPSDEVAQFAEEVMSAESMNTIKASIESRLGKNGMTLSEVRSTQGKSARINQPKLLPTVKIAPKTITRPVKQSGSAPGRLVWLIGFLLIALSVLLAAFFINGNMQEQQKEAEALSRELKQQQKVNNIFTEYISGDKQKAREQMVTLNYHDLKSDMQRDIYIKWLVDGHQYSKALSLDESSAYLIGRKINHDNKEDIEKLAAEEKNEVLDFYLAGKEGHYQKVINLADKVNLKEPSVANAIVRAFVLTGSDNNLDSFMDEAEKKFDSGSKEMKNITRTYKYYKPYVQSLNDVQAQYDKKEKEIRDLEKAVSNKKTKSKKSSKKLTAAKKEQERLKEKIQDQRSDIKDVKTADIIASQDK